MNRRLSPLTYLGLALAAVAVLVAAGPAASPPRARPSIEGQIDARIRARHDALIAIRRDIHRHPEVAGNEVRTAALVAKELRRAGLQVRAGVGGHGVIGILRGGKPGPVVGYRADMDAVADPAPDPVDFRSIVIGIRHVCGHDVHTTIGLGVADALAAVKRDLPGTVLFYFQPAEETTEGAQAMIQDGALIPPAPSAIFALHCSPLEVGTMAAIEGLVLPGLDAVTVRLSGTGGLGDASRKMVEALNALSTPRTGGNPDSFVVVEMWNQGLPDGDHTVQVSAGIRASNDSLYALVERAVRKRAANLDVPGVTADVAYRRELVPATANNVEVVRATYPALRRALGTKGLEVLPRGTRYFSEDFSHFLKRVPGGMYFLGVSNEKKKIVGMPHSPGFAVDEAAIDAGSRAMARLLADYLARGAAAAAARAPKGAARTG